MRNFLKLTPLVALLLAFSDCYASEYLAPSNVYITNGDNQRIEVVTKNENLEKHKDSKNILIADPVHSNDQLKINAEKQIKEAKKKALIAEENLYKPSKLKFQTLNLKGRIAKPRVKFERTSLPTGRVDEKYNSDFFKKVFEVKDDLDF